MVPTRMAPVGRWFSGTASGGLRFTAGGDGAVISTAAITAAAAPDILVSRGDGRWYVVSPGDSVGIPAGRSVWFRAVADRGQAGFRFQAEGGFSVSGDPMWLVSTTNPAGRPLTSGVFASLFSGCSSLESAAELELTRSIPESASSCYEYMFSNCTSLAAAPDLPSETVAASCYGYMFNGCTSLVVAPGLPATTLASRCYDSMFSGCSSLSSVPETLPATELVSSCYRSMFRECASLDTSPVIAAVSAPAGTATNAMAYMFYGCTSLSSVSVHFTEWPSAGYWLYNVSFDGVFHCPAALGTGETISRGVDSCPTGWLVVNDVT